MCGIAGRFNFSPTQPIDRGRLRAMTTALAHRGPDADGYYVGDGIGLGHRRLSIIDLSTGDQPLSNEDGTIWTVFNGEIYNFADVRKELESYGHVFRTNTDTEIIVHGYEQWGPEAVTRFRGMFAIALWDAPRRRLLLVRDRLGVKPLYYSLLSSGMCSARRSRRCSRTRTFPVIGAPRHWMRTWLSATCRARRPSTKPSSSCRPHIT